MNYNPAVYTLENQAFRLTITNNTNSVGLEIIELASQFMLADSPYFYRVVRNDPDCLSVFTDLQAVSVTARPGSLAIRGSIAGLAVEHKWLAPLHEAYLEEQIQLTNHSRQPISLLSIQFGARRRITNAVGKVDPELSKDRFLAVPFLTRPTDPPGQDNDYDIAHLLTYTGHEPRVNEFAALSEGQGSVPSNQYYSEGWMWRHGEASLVMYKFNQDAMEFSVLAVDTDPAGVFLRFAGMGMLDDEPSSFRKILPGATIRIGVTRIERVKGEYAQASYAYRNFLDAQGCRFPEDYNPPVHWNELYDNAEWTLGTPGYPPGKRMTRPYTYTRQQLLKEAASARGYHCEALYLDPGWDTDFGTFYWGENWLGKRKSFIDQLSTEFGLRLSLHTPLATWMSFDGRGVSSWPEAATRMDIDGKLIRGSICLGSRQYLAEAEKRLLAHCGDGVAYLMFDGNWWNGGCWNPNHGHPVPYTKEDHCQANLTLAQRIHAKYPKVIIEMHDMIAGGSVLRYTPVYYKYGLPGSYDENWGLELMWQPMEDIRSGRSRALYYYNLGCNVPVYLHVDLRQDNQYLLVFWWYASTCRHLGIGGTHENPLITQAHRLAMQKYRRLERFYKRGHFYGPNENVHIHAIPGENAFIINLFNLSDEAQLIQGTVLMDEMGLARNLWYRNTPGGSFDSHRGSFHIQRWMEPWSAQLGEVYPLEFP